MRESKNSLKEFDITRNTITTGKMEGGGMKIKGMCEIEKKGFGKKGGRG